mmetsp:Transcript_26235/g.30081  ORF Transcript_26235/g.30081 Transcript_26235/m.30081 type:complete len:86 (-) Transcript_26235:817-1074(-)
MSSAKFHPLEVIRRPLWKSTRIALEVQGSEVSSKRSFLLSWNVGFYSFSLSLSCDSLQGHPNKKMKIDIVEIQSDEMIDDAIFLR